MSKWSKTKRRSRNSSFRLGRTQILNNSNRHRTAAPHPPLLPNQLSTHPPTLCPTRSQSTFLDRHFPRSLPDLAQTHHSTPVARIARSTPDSPVAPMPSPVRLRRSRHVKISIRVRHQDLSPPWQGRLTLWQPQSVNNSSRCNSRGRHRSNNINNIRQRHHRPSSNRSCSRGLRRHPPRHSRDPRASTQCRVLEG